MPSLFIIIFILMMLALIIGFLIGWILRRRATRQKYAEHIDKLTKEDDALASKLHTNAANLTTNENNHAYVLEKIDATNEEIHLYAERNIAVVREIKELHTNQQKLEEQVKHIDGDVSQSKKDLKLLQEQREELLSLKNSHFEQKKEVEQKTKEIDVLKEHIQSLITDRDTLTQKSNNILATISKLEDKIKDKSQQVHSVEEEFEKKTATIRHEIDRNKHKALNYQYAIEHVNEKLNSSEDLTADAIDKIISKNEETKIFENIIQKLFKKSAKYIKGVK